MRVLTEDDVPAGLALSREAGWNQTAEDWRFIIRHGEAVGAFTNGRLIATSAAVPQGPHFGWIAMVLVTAAERRKGHAKRLASRSLAFLSETGRGAGLDATPKGRPLYETLGFRPAGAITRYLALDPARGAPADAALSLTRDRLPGVAAFDASVYGADRSAILEHLLTQSPEVAFVADTDGGKGYVLARTGSIATQIGPVVSTTSATASALLDGALAATAGPVVIDVPEGASDFAATLEARGFAPRRPFERMYRGRSRNEATNAIAAIAGPELG